MNIKRKQNRTVSELIAENSGQLSPAQRRIAEVVAADPTVVAFGTVSQIAEAARTSRPTVVRFANRLGFEGFSELQAYAQGRLTRLLSRPRDRIRHPEQQSAPAFAEIEKSVADVMAFIETKRFSGVVTAICEADNVWILSGETSMAGAQVLASGLTMIRRGIRLLDDHHVGRDLTTVGTSDVVVAIDFYRYRRATIRAAQVLKEMGVGLVAITDGPLSPLAGLTESWCGLDIPAVGPFDSSVPTVLLAELIVAEAARRLADGISELIDRTESFWERTDIFLASDS